MNKKAFLFTDSLISLYIVVVFSILIASFYHAYITLEKSYSEYNLRINAEMEAIFMQEMHCNICFVLEDE